jgi:hypothetical protein
MTIPNTVRADQAFGIPGEFAFDSPSRVQPGTIDPAQSAAESVIGRYFSKHRVTGLYTSVGNALTDAALIFGGILGFPKEQALYGDALAPSMLVPPGSTDAQFVEMGMVNAFVINACKEGDVVAAEVGTGKLYAYVNAAAVPAVTHFLIPNAKVYRSENSVAGGAVVCVKLTN